MSEETAASEEAGERDDAQEKQEATEKRAREMGWRPKEEFKGDPDKWTDAMTYVQRGETVLPIIKAERDRLRTEIAEIRSTVKQFAAHHATVEKRAYEKALADARRELNQAVKEGDEKTAEAKAEEIAELRANKPAEGKEAIKEIAPEVKEWLADNRWFHTDELLRDYATRLHDRFLRDRPDLSLEENLALVSKDVKKRFPEKFDNPYRSKPPAVEGSSGAASRGNGKKSYADLPVDAKAACDRFVKTIPGYTRDKYVKEFFGEQ
jgi:hypothetical protein